MSLVQVFLRLQWVRQVVRGRYMNAELSLAGLGLVVMGGLQDELFNLTIDRIQVCGVSGQHLVSFELNTVKISISFKVYGGKTTMKGVFESS